MATRFTLALWSSGTGKVTIAAISHHEVEQNSLCFVLGVASMHGISGWVYILYLSVLFCVTC